MCKHENEIIERCCVDCGAIVEQHDMVSGWVANHFVHTAPQNDPMIKELLGIGLSFDQLRKIYDNVAIVSKIKDCGLKGRRRKGLIFACIFSIRKCDPDILRKQLGLTRKECERGVHLFEECISNLKWTWKMLLHSKLKTLGLVEIEDDVIAQILMSRSKTRVSILLASCVVELLKLMRSEKHSPEHVRKVFCCEKIVKFNLKRIKLINNRK